MKIHPDLHASWDASEPPADPPGSSIRVVPPEALLDLDRITEAVAGDPSVCLSPNRCACVRSAGSRLPEIPGDRVAFDADRGLWLDVATLAEHAEDRDTGTLDGDATSRVRVLFRRLRALATTRAALGAALSFMIASGGAYERGIDQYLDRASQGETVFTDHPMAVHVTAVFVGAAEYGRDAVDALRAFGDRVEEKDDSVRTLADPRTLPAAMPEGVVRDHAGPADSALRRTQRPIQERADGLIHDLLPRVREQREADPPSGTRGPHRP